MRTIKQQNLKVDLILRLKTAAECGNFYSNKDITFLLLISHLAKLDFILVFLEKWKSIITIAGILWALQGSLRPSFKMQEMGDTTLWLYLDYAHLPLNKKYKMVLEGKSIW